MGSDAESAESGLRQRIAQLSRENIALLSEIEKLESELLSARSIQRDLPPAYETGIFAESYMLPRLREEICRAGRYRHYLSMVAVQLVPRSETREMTGMRLPKEFARRMRELLRATDILFVLGDGRISIILPETSETESGRVVDRLRCLVNGEVHMACAVASYPHDANHETALISEAFERLDRQIATWNR